jgi:hypothetical protein
MQVSALTRHGMTILEETLQRWHRKSTMASEDLLLIVCHFAFTVYRCRSSPQVFGLSAFF